MSEGFMILAAIGIWLFLQIVVLPKMGINS